LLFFIFFFVLLLSSTTTSKQKKLEQPKSLPFLLRSAPLSSESSQSRTPLLRLFSILVGSPYFEAFLTGCSPAQISTVSLNGVSRLWLLLCFFRWIEFLKQITRRSITVAPSCVWPLLWFSRLLGGYDDLFVEVLRKILLFAWVYSLNIYYCCEEKYTRYNIYFLSFHIRSKLFYNQRKVTMVHVEV